MHTFRAPARIPLFLRVVGKNSDDSPKVVSLRQTIDLCDQISICQSDMDHFQSLSPLILETIALYRKKSGNLQSVTIKIESKVPIRVGLDAQSSHGATVLWALNQLADKPVSEETLQGWGAELNSEIPFFFTSGTARSSEFGLESLESLPRKEVWIATSEHDMPKDALLKRLALLDLQDRELEKILERYLVAPEYFNDFEEAAYALNPKLAIFRQQIAEKGFQSVVLAGTGPSFFCLNPITAPQPDNQLIATHYLNREKGNWY